MAPRNGVAGIKRKSSSSVKSTNDHPTKKAKVGSTRKNLAVEAGSDEMDSDDSFGSLSDPDDGGVELEAESAAERGPRRNGGSARADGGPAGKTFEKGKDTSREAHAKQKQLAQERKAAKPLADEVHRTKKLWEKLRRKSHVAKEERQVLVEELYQIITGRVKDFVLKHDAVRAVQTAVKYSNTTQRKQIARELQGTYPQLAESKYAKFLIGKLLVQNDDEIRDLIIPEFYGKVRKLINHTEASWILDDVYRGVATREQKAILLREWYGPDFALFVPEKGVEVTADLPLILENEPGKRPTVLKYLFDMINGLVQKQLTGFTILHDAMLQYFLCLKSDSAELKEFIEVIKGDETGDLLKNMAFTKSGARLSCLLLAHGSAKDRRAILKAYKDTLHLMCGDPNAYMVILAAYDVIDDTVTTSKAIFPELVGKDDSKGAENVIFLANDLTARITALYLLEGPSKVLFPASRAGDLALLREIHEIRENTSKKNPETRRTELVAALSPYLLSAIAAFPSDLVSTSFGCQFVAEVMLSAPGDKTAALVAIASTAAGDPNAPVPEHVYPPPPPHISHTAHGGRMFKSLIAGGRFDKTTGEIKLVDPPLRFAETFYAIAKDHIVAWATGPSSFVVVSLLEAADFSSKDELLRTLRAEKKKLTKAANEETPEQKAKREAAAESAAAPKAKNKAKKAKGKGEVKPQVGNHGTKLLLEKLAA
ncbi:ARM repeat-containing protein [Thozetella sp. PMI_491]|nr:ARM repeat-containing protein [Thozetella sp. PMI_491]